jgi:competence protein ComEC
VNLALAALIWVLSFVFADAEQSRIKTSYPQFDLVDWFRDRFLTSLNGISPDAEALVAGLTIGERTLLSQEVEIQMKTLSLTHLVAVSGANLAIVIGAVYFLLAGLGVARNLRFVVALVAMAGYVLLVGPESSVIRAATMAIFVMIGLWLGRGSTPLNSLSLAIIVLLATDPGLAKDIGFALSAFATAGLLILAPPVFEWLRRFLPDFIALGAAASFAAQLFTTPVLLILQPSIPVYSVLANLIVEPVVAPVTILGIVAVVVSAISIPLAGAISYLASIFAGWIVLVAAELASWPMARVHFVQGLNGILLVAAIVILIALSYGVLASNGRQLRFAAVVVLLVSVSWSTTDVLRFQRFAGEFTLLACDVGQGDALIVQDSGQVALIDVGKDPEAIDSCLSAAGVSQIDLLVLTHFDADHVAGIQGALKNRSVSLALASGFEDDRPLVSIVERELAARGVQLTIGRSGVGGKLGGLDWKILQPSFDAAEATDSNDASLVSAFWNQEQALLALGDLGEEGQLRLMRNSMPDLSMLRTKNLVLKVAHHGSADQSTDLMKYLAPEYALFLVGKNDYGHPTSRALELAKSNGAVVLRTDEHGPIALHFGEQIEVFLGGKLSP